ncbi:MAG: hypothetical protein sL5_04840 [Candidatus Mesenet longicola]|uniref:Uncharacterized protein n=1 Tax=Candidatus Mesenet longicola TaxID=1892558 RepID=A0A8J3HXR4_9RICK|nr:MAG: hypothetical protein sGL2_04960 [Candidatus Mesenet longicola]GHM59491.1 MAG: hypothetical protein sL5_04840 [Candidatus Mesenet longicola]
MPGNNTLSEQYDDFLDNHVKKDFERIVQGKSLKVKYIENFYGDALDSSALSFSVVGTKNRLELYDNRHRCYTSIAWDQSLKPIDFYSNNAQSRFCKFIVQQFLSEGHSTEKIENQDDQKITQFSSIALLIIVRIKKQNQQLDGKT